MNGTNAVVKGRETRVLLLHHAVSHQKTAIHDPRSSLSPDTKFVGALILDLPAFRTVRNIFYCL